MTERTMTSEGWLRSARAASMAPATSSMSFASDTDTTVPPIGAESLADQLAEGQVGVSLDRDMVGGVQGDQLAEVEVAGQGRRLGGHPLHEVAVAAEDVGVVVHDVVAGPVVPSGQHPLGDGQTHGVGDALAAWPGRDLHARGEPPL